MSPLGRSRRGAAGPAGGAERRLVAGQDPSVADRRPHRRQRPAERIERCAAPGARRSPPTRRTPRAWRGRRRAGTDARARDARRAGRPRSRHRPDERPPRALPPDQHRAGRRGVPKRVAVYAERAPSLTVGHPPAVEDTRAGGRRCPPPSPAGRVVRQPAEREDREVARRRRRRRCTAAPRPARATGPPRWTAGPPRRARGSRAARPAACCPAGPPTPQAGASPSAAGAVRRARRRAAGTPGSAPASGRWLSDSATLTPQYAPILSGSAPGNSCHACGVWSRGVGSLGVSRIGSCASWGPACGTGRHLTRSGSQPSPGRRTSPRMRSTMASGCCSSTRLVFRRRSSGSRSTARQRSCSLRHGTSAMHRASSSASATRSTRRCPIRQKTSCGRTASPSSKAGSARTCAGWSTRRLARRTGTRPVTICPSESQAFPRTEAQRHGALGREPSCGRRRRHARRASAKALRSTPTGFRAGMTREQVVDGLRPLLALPVEHLLETHGGPFDRAALERALS